MLSLCRRNRGANSTDNTSSNKDGSLSDSGSVVNIARGNDDLKTRKRLMRSSGHNVITTGVPDRNRKYFSDLYTTLIDIQWRWNILIFLGGFILTWIVFACIYYLQMHLHGDFENNDNNNDYEGRRKVSHAPCLDNVQSFTAAYLFSIETMTTIGYGYRGPTEECPGVYLAVLIQSILGAGLQFALASLVVSKTRRAKRRSGTILFSKHICICEQDSSLQLAVRVADMRKSEICGAHAKGFLIKKLRSGDGTLVPIRSFTLTFKSQSGRDDIFFPWPTQLLHTVDEDSPLWSLSRADFLSGKFELIVVLDGVCGSTSSSFQARKSYHTHEMKWGYRFATLDMTYKDSTYFMDLSNFHHTVPASTPLCSAQDINSLRVLYSANHPEYRHSPSPSPKARFSSISSTQKTSRSVRHDKNSSSTKRKKSEKKSPTHKQLQQQQQKQPSSPEHRLLELSAQNLMLSCTSSLYTDDSRRNSRSPSSQTTHRSRSMEEKRGEGAGGAKSTLWPDTDTSREKVRRCSLGDLIRTTRPRDNADDSEDTILGDAKNMYKHRKSVTDTYLGADIEEEEDWKEEETNYLAVMSVVSQRSADRRVDVRDVFKTEQRRRRSSVSKLFFGPETCSSSDDTSGGEEIVKEDLSAHSSRSNVNRDVAGKKQRSSPRDKRLDC